jgi:hypothetical protein
MATVLFPHEAHNPFTANYYHNTMAAVTTHIFIHVITLRTKNPLTAVNNQPTRLIMQTDILWLCGNDNALYVRFQVLTAASMMFRAVFWVVDNHFTRQYNPEDSSEQQCSVYY